MNPLGLFLEPPGSLFTHLHTVFMACSEYLPTRLNPLAERTCFCQVRGRLLAYYNGPSGLASLCGDNPEELVEFVEGDGCAEVTEEEHARGAGDDGEDEQVEEEEWVAVEEQVEDVVHEQVEEELYWVAVGEEPQELTLEGLIEVRPEIHRVGP